MWKNSERDRDRKGKREKRKKKKKMFVKLKSLALNAQTDGQRDEERGTAHEMWLRLRSREQQQQPPLQLVHVLYYGQPASHVAMCRKPNRAS